MRFEIISLKDQLASAKREYKDGFMIDASTQLDSQARQELGNVLDFSGMLDLQDYQLNRRYLPQTL